MVTRPNTAMQQNPYQPGQRIPLPPPPQHPHPSQAPLGVPIPPPPPRTAYQQNHGMVLPGPPSAVPSTPLSYWARNQTYPGPPMSATPTYNPGAYQNAYAHHPQFAAQQLQHPQQLHAQHQQQRSQDSAPLVSATYIPGSDSFGPGVGIPPLYTPTEEHSSGYFRDSDTYSTVTDTSRGNETNITTPDESSYYDNRTFNGTINVDRSTQGYVSPGPPTATLVNPQRPQTSHDSQATKPPISPSDPAHQWTPERVQQWMRNQAFSNEWQEAFKSLNIHGAQFLDLGRSGNQGRNGLSFMYQIVMPQIARECQNTETKWDQTREREVAKQLRKMVKRVLEHGGGFSLPPAAHKRNGSLGDADAEHSPSLERRDMSTPTTAGTGDDSPGQFMPLLGTSPSSAMFQRTLSQQKQGQLAQGSDYNSETGRSTYAEQMLRNAGDAYGKRHSPSPSLGEENGTYARQRHASPQQSPALASAHPANASSATSQFPAPGHFRTTSAEYARRNGTDSSRPSPMETRHNSDTPGSAKEHKSFFGKFSRKKRDDHTDESSASMESPTSPATHRTLLGGLPFARNNGSATSLQSGLASAGGVALHAAGAVGRTEPRRFAFITADGFNYKLVDISGADSPLLMKQVISTCLGITFSPDIGLHITSPGQEVHDEALSDDLLMHARRSLADTMASLKIFVHAPSYLPGADVQTGMSSPYKASFSGKPIDEATQQRIRGNSNPQSAGRSPGDGTLAASEAERMMQLDHAAELHRQETERKQAAYLEDRRRHLNKTSPIDVPGIHGTREINFDERRKTPYEARDLVPLREPPPVPPDTSTLIKANSLTKKDVQRIRQCTREEEKRRSGEGRPSSSGSTMQSPPLRREESHRQRSMGIALAAAMNRERSGSGGSPRSPSFTMSKGNVGFKIPDYEEDPLSLDPNGIGSEESTLTQDKSDAVKGVDRSGSASKPSLTLQTSMQNPTIAKLKSYNATLVGRASPDVSPSDPKPPSSLQRMVSKRGPTHDFVEADVSFDNRSSGVPTYHSDDDSDDGLFAVKLTQRAGETPSTATPKAPPPAPMQETNSAEERAPFKMRTNGNRNGLDSPSASTMPQSASTASPIIDHLDKQFEAGFEGGSTIPQSATSVGWSPDEPSRFDRRESFASDVWANRPPAEALVEHLDEFFPNVNLDEPVLPEENFGAIPESPSDDPGTMPAGLFSSRSTTPLSSVDEDSDGVGSLKRGNLTSLAQRNIRKSGLGRSKSIREVVEHAYGGKESVRNSFIGMPPGPSRVATLRQSAVGSIVRRKSTKMFGAKIEQIKPPRGSRLINLETIPQDTLPVLQKQPTFKWMKGQLIGKGTFGRVYLGMNMTTGELIAVKQVEVRPQAQGQDKEKMKEMVKSLDIEIDTMKDLDHPNIVSYLGCERKELSISIFLEYISGGSVGSCLRKHGKFEEPVVSSLTRQTLSALAYLHREGILHRDLKADNILLDLDGTCKISDFGISKKSDDIYGNDVTNSMQGSVFWMAPEVIRSQGQGYSAKVDIWSLGCVVLEMFAGRRPWSKEEAIGAIYKLGSLNEAPPIPDDVSETISPGAISFMYDCFTIDPKERPTADTLLRAPFCFLDHRYNFLDSDLYAKIKGAFSMPPTGA